MNGFDPFEVFRFDSSLTQWQVFFTHCGAVYFNIWSMCNMRFLREDECSLETCHTHHTGAMSISHSLTGCYLSSLLTISLSVIWTQAAGNDVWWCSTSENRHLAASKLTDTTRWQMIYRSKRLWICTCLWLINYTGTISIIHISIKALMKFYHFF